MSCAKNPLRTHGHDNRHARCGAQIISLKLDMVSLTAAHKEAGAAAEAAPADSVAAVNREVLRQVRTALGGFRV